MRPDAYQAVGENECTLQEYHQQRANHNAHQPPEGSAGQLFVEHRMPELKSALQTVRSQTHTGAIWFSPPLHEWEAECG